MEIDSNYHDQNYDRARDEYLNIMFGIHTLRLFGFGVTPSCQTLQVNDFMLTLTKLRYVTPVRIDYSELILYMFYKDNEDIMEVLNIIEDTYLSGNITDNTYIINKSDGMITKDCQLERVASIIYGMYKVRVFLV